MANFLTFLTDSVNEILTLISETLSLAARCHFLSVTLCLQLLVILAGLLCFTWLLMKLCVCFLAKGEPGYTHVAFFHPYCNAGGGGERVLWCAIRSIQKKYPKVKCYIYTGDTDATPQEILHKAQDRFNVVLPRHVEFIYLRSRTFVEAKHYPLLTLLMQSIGSVFLGSEALSKFCPDICIDTMGYAFTYPVFRYIGGCIIGSYTHYPTISTDMLERVADRIESHNNRGIIARNVYFSYMKVIYYHLFAMLYCFVGRCAHVVMVNSSWTHGHITSLWGNSNHAHIVYPPCDTEKFKSLVLLPDSEKTLKTVVSIGQFRPEKDHQLQLNAFQKLCNILPPDESENVRLVLIGGCRNEEDQERVESLQNLASELGIDEKVIWKLNASFTDLLDAVQQGTIGLHTMRNEHFGICIVECMAGGLIMVAHDSGGPQMDIVVDYESQQTGYRATDTESYAEAMKAVLESTDFEKECIRNAARSSVDRFSDAEFETTFLSATEALFQTP